MTQPKTPEEQKLDARKMKIINALRWSSRQASAKPLRRMATSGIWKHFTRFDGLLPASLEERVPIN
jgi:hypothetical protein